jgi:hypothetical protein
MLVSGRLRRELVRKKEEKNFFFEKKKQKTFSNVYATPWEGAAYTNRQKFFGSFFQKRTTSLYTFVSRISS